jgi:hypothetical protein
MANRDKGRRVACSSDDREAPCELLKLHTNRLVLDLHCLF